MSDSLKKALLGGAAYLAVLGACALVGPGPAHTQGTVQDVRVTNTAVIIEATMPRISVTAKPLTGPVPNWKRKSAVSTVLTFESTMAFMACLNPSSTDSRTVFPCMSSSLILSKISTLSSTAIPI